MKQSPAIAKIDKLLTWQFVIIRTPHNRGLFHAVEFARKNLPEMSQENTSLPIHHQPHFRKKYFRNFAGIQELVDSWNWNPWQRQKTCIWGGNYEKSTKFC